MNRNNRTLALGIMTILLSLQGIDLQAQPTGQLQILTMTNDGSVLDVKIQVKGSAPFDMGTSNLVFTYTSTGDTSIINPTLLDAYNFTDNAYSAMTMTIPVSGRLSLNIFLMGSPPTTVGTTWMDVATVRFTTANKMGEAVFDWKLTGPGRTYLYEAGSPATLLNVDTAFGLAQHSLPIELSAFSGSRIGDGALLQWTTAGETNGYGFDIERTSDGTEFTSIGFVPARNMGAAIQSYAFRDMGPLPAGEQGYRLLMIDADGTRKFSPTVFLHDAGPGAATRLEPLYPNPSRGDVSVSFALAAAANVTLTLYDLTGQEVRRVRDNEPLGAGSYFSSMNVTDLPPGFYILRFRAGHIQRTEILMRSR